MWLHITCARSKKGFYSLSFILMSLFVETENELKFQYLVQRKGPKSRCQTIQITNIAVSATKQHQKWRCDTGDERTSIYPYEILWLWLMIVKKSHWNWLVNRTSIMDIILQSSFKVMAMTLPLEKFGSRLRRMLRHLLTLYFTCKYWN